MTTVDILSRISLDPLSAEPLYRQLADSLSSLMTGGTLQPGDAMPTEDALCERLGVSRTTARTAYSELVDAGQVVRRPRKGTVVAEPKLPRSLDSLYNFSGEMAKLGMRPTSKVLGFDVTTPPDWAARRLGVPDDTPVYEIRRLRLADENPLLLESVWVPTRLCPGLTAKQLESSLYALISRASGVTPVEARETYEAVRMGAADARPFGLKEGEPAFIIRRTTLNERGEAFECSRIVAPGDRNRYEVTLRRDGSSSGGVRPAL
ncbi:UTRA domain-containing protein [uncultured Parolsenella sp.]|uniref:GntR family transcriptional regulator n=1 Tax=uncultured Parolsenella sp. TaxID=2083008 RepID=UPI0027D95074|nr:UTRA domain-containing protein [uncultured Parolsenella sp.]